MLPITVIIPHLPERGEMLQRALASVASQTLPPAAVIVELDLARSGEAATRNRAISKATTPLVAFLDDDDEMLPDHLSRLSQGLQNSGADLSWSDYEIVGASGYRASFIEIATLVKTEALKQIGGFPQAFSSTWPYVYPDWGMLAKLLNAGRVFHRVDAVTWVKHIHGSNISGTSTLSKEDQL